MVDKNVQATAALVSQIERSKMDAFGGQDVPWLLETWATKTPDKVVMVWEPADGNSVNWTYAELTSKARRFAQGLANRDVKAGDFVIIHLDNSPEFVVAWIACAYLGAVAVSTNTHCVARDLEYFADHTSAVCAITQPGYASMIEQACADVNFLVVTSNDAGVPAAETLPFDYTAYDALFAENALALRPSDPMANLGVQFTSGTTSRPKAVLWTHANGLYAARTGAAQQRLRQDDTGLLYSPMFHTMALGWGFLPTLWVGGSFVLVPKFSASRFWDISVRNKITFMSQLPFVLKAIQSQPVPEHAFRLWGFAAYVSGLEQLFNVKLISTWGMTEVLTQGIVSDIDLPGPEGSLGRPSAAIDIQIRKEDGSLAGPGERGVLFVRGVRGVSIFKEYYRNDEANAEAFDENGWFNTGDIIRCDEHGNLYFSDRDKDMLKVGGENVAASEIEVVINQTGLVSECAVVGQKHTMLDEVPVVFVIPAAEPGEDFAETLIAHCRENLADFKVPRDVIVVDELPRSTLEKIAKAELRKRLPLIEA